MELSYCPSCGYKLTRRDIADVNAIGYKCENGHCLHLLSHSVLTAETMGRYLSVRSGKTSTEDTIREWLSNPNLRNHLNDSLANVLRYILENKDIKETRHEQYSYDFCPLCSNALKDQAVDDLYIAFLRCPNNHAFISRQGLRFYDTSPTSETIEFDLTSQNFSPNFVSWTSNPHFQQYVPLEIVNVLNEHKAKMMDKAQ